MRKETGELLKILESSANIDDYLNENKEELVSYTLHDELSKIIEKEGIKPSELFRKAGIERTYGYEILSGKKNPSRDKALSIFFALRLSAEDVQRILKASGYAPLYARIKRDSVILFSLQKNLTLIDTNELLYEMNLPEIK